MKTFSIYEAKAKLSELIRFVKNHGPVVITERGVPVVEVAAYSKKPKSLEERTKHLQNLGLLYGDAPGQAKIQPVVKRPGALKRFLESRD